MAKMFFGHVQRLGLDDVTLLGLDELAAAFHGDREQVTLAYAQSHALVAYLSEQNPAAGIGGLLEQLDRGRDMRLALGLAFGRPVPEMEEEWLDGLRRRLARQRPAA